MGTKAGRERVPMCVAAMGCLCAGHARGNDPGAPCDTSEGSDGFWPARSMRFGRVTATCHPQREGHFKGGETVEVLWPDGGLTRHTVTVGVDHPGRLPAYIIVNHRGHLVPIPLDGMNLRVLLVQGFAPPPPAATAGIAPRNYFLGDAQTSRVPKRRRKK